MTKPFRSLASQRRLLRALAACTLALGFSGCFLSYSPIIDGATSDLEIRVVDDEGTPVPDAKVSAVYYITPEKVKVKEGKTDERGFFRARGRTIGEIHVYAKKEGYYEGHVLPEFRLLSIEEATPVRRWAMEKVPVPVRLKRIHSPTHLVVNGGKETTWRDMQYPATNAVMGFDLLAFDWCPPFGKGEYADFQIKREFWRAEDDWFKYWSRTVIAMTNGMDGFYLADADPTSAFRYAYEADPHARFEKELVFECDRRSGVVTNRAGVPRGKYLVFRTRTVTDPEGNVISAHYGIIQEKMVLLGRLDLTSIFNPVANDTRLEGNWPHKLSSFDKEDFTNPQALYD
jgi:hypothetical protein